MAEPATEAAKGFIDALKGQPLSLALVAMNLGLLGFLYYSGIQLTNYTNRELELLYQNRKDVADLLFRCHPPPPTGG